SLASDNVNDPEKRRHPYPQDPGHGGRVQPRPSPVVVKCLRESQSQQNDNSVKDDTRALQSYCFKHEWATSSKATALLRVISFVRSEFVNRGKSKVMRT